MVLENRGCILRLLTYEGGLYDQSGLRVLATEGTKCLSMYANPLVFSLQDRGDLLAYCVPR